MTATSSQSFVGVAGHNEFFDSNQDVVQNIDGRDGNDIIEGKSGDDILYGGLGRDFIFGEGGDDTIYGDQSFNDETKSANQTLAAEADVLLGLGGSDTIFAGGGNNFVDGGDGDDFIWGGSGNEFLVGGTGDDTISGLSGNDVLFGGTDTAANQRSFLSANVGSVTTNFEGTDDSAEDHTFAASDFGDIDLAPTGTGSDTLDGGAGNDILNGQDGADTMIGGAGNDRFYVDNAADVVKEGIGEGSDYVLASVSYGLKAGVEVEKLSTTSTGGSTAISLTGNEFGQQIYGNAAGNKINALDGNDTLLGYDGNDSLFGGAGKDTLVGGLGNDQFYFNTALDAATNIDTITDFKNVSGNDDTIRLENAVFTKLAATGTLNAAFLAANASGTAADSNDYIVYNTSTGALLYDADGNGAGHAIQFATLTGHPALTAADFLVV